MDRNERIRQRAHEIWEREGRPEGRQDAHWEEACRDITAAEGSATGGAAKSTDTELSRDPDTGAALAGDPTGWINAADPDGEMAAAGEADPSATARGRRKAKPAT